MAPLDSLVVFDKGGIVIEGPIRDTTGRATRLSESCDIADYKWLADGTKLQVADSTGRGYAYLGSLVYEKEGPSLTLESIGFNGGRIVASEGASGADYAVHYQVTDHLIGTNDYFAFGLRHNSGIVNDNNRFRYNGKELQTTGNLGFLDYGARMYDAEIRRWFGIDILSEKYYPYGPYVFTANNPIIYIDDSGMDWFYYATSSEEEPTWHWHEGGTYDSGIQNDEGNNIILQGVEAVVVFNGSLGERLGTNGAGNRGYVNGEGAITADVTVYGPGGEDDTTTYIGYTMSSDPGKYGIVANGIYDGNYDAIGKGGVLKSNWVLNNRGNVHTYWENPNEPNQIDENGLYYMTGVFIHRSNNNGFAGTYKKNGAISKGCLLIAPNDWARFNKKMNGISNFKVQVIRPAITPYRRSQIQ